MKDIHKQKLKRKKAYYKDWIKNKELGPLKKKGT